MPYGLYISAEGARAQNTRLEVIANNLANVDTVGFKRELAIVQARHAEAISRGRDYAGSGSVNGVGGGVMVRQTQTDFSQGPIKATGVATDLALRCEGFFTVKSGQEMLLTRAGNFRLTPGGELVTQQGYPVLDESGAPVVLTNGAAPWEITPDGGLRQGNELQRLGIVQPESLAGLAKVGDNLFRPDGRTQPIPAAQREVVAEHLEMSLAHSTTEMIDLIEASRAVEANVNLMQSQDQMLGGLFNRLMRT